MTNICGQTCDRCGLTAKQVDSGDSTDLIQAKGDGFLFFGDVHWTEPHRLSLWFGDKAHHYCPDCLVAEVQEFAAKCKARGPSKGVAERTYRKPAKGG